MKFFSILLFLPLTGAIPTYKLVEDSALVGRRDEDDQKSPSSTSASPVSVPRLVMYVQTFTTPDKQPLSLLPLLKHETQVTHIILASIHLQKEPGVITLNDDPLDAPIHDSIWEEVKTLRANGIKVMALLGGAAAGTYARLNGTNEEVSSP